MNAQNGFHRRVPSGLFATGKARPELAVSRPRPAAETGGDTHVCDKCGARVLELNDFCLRCGHELPRERRDSSDGFHHLLTTVMTTLVLVGSTTAVWMGIDLYLFDRVEEPMTFQQSASTTTCFQTSEHEKAAEYTAAGWREVPAENGLRCFEHAQ